MSQWLPMQTAPKNGARVLLLVEDGFRWTGGFRRPPEALVGEWESAGWLVATFEYGGERLKDDQILGWFPIPEGEST